MSAFDPKRHWHYHEADRRMMGVRLKKIILAALLTAFANGAGADDTPMMPPFPPGFVTPYRRLIDWPHIPSADKTDPGLFCVYLDIGKDGHVSNVTMLQSTGNSHIDNVLMRWYESRSYGPATLNDVPVTVRILSEFPVGNSKVKRNCNWDLYRSR
jgi:hypothetical protein